MKKRVMLLTVTAGEGHNSAMKTVKGKLESEGDEVKVVNVFQDHASAFKYHIINEGYLLLCKYFRPLFNLGFKMCISKNPERRDSVGVHSFLKNETASFLKDILDFKPDIIFATHVYGAVMALNLRRTYDLPYKVIFLFTDCMVYPYAECAVTADKVIIPYSDLTESYLKVGYTVDQILPYGIPVKEKFYLEDNISKTDYRKNINLDENLFTVMLMLGGGGGDNMFRMFKQVIKVKKPIQILVVCGKDVKTKKKIDKYLAKHTIIHKVVNYGFISNVEEVMSASDLLLGKCGGLSSTEAVCKRLPLMVTTKLLIQEIANYEFLLRNGAVVELKKGEKISSKIETCMLNPEILETIKNNLNRIRNHNIMENIYGAINSFDVVNYASKFDYLRNYKKSKIKKDVKTMLNASKKRNKK